MSYEYPDPPTDYNESCLMMHIDKKSCKMCHGYTYDFQSRTCTSTKLPEECLVQGHLENNSSPICLLCKDQYVSTADAKGECKSIT